MIVDHNIFWNLTIFGSFIMMDFKNDDSGEDI